ncbi:UDP-Glycosyltransferase/glycogen phosphorylase [Lentinus tigrinus ALCF2SS1-6]|uniref:UDP-Glycosyltransferase/glycogen phosphorylase n=1 Tax=Lentinus tigrinus ALCF2SS1-6 TaxID=1328759 RepID=A0A5C2S7S6_9APHY|nr:UDP-Glycosyltransferase/glycogen phosphorylase [Lentinus tigrinus ALCF2SS1-6]
MTVDTQKHVVVFPTQMWGHCRTMCTLVARMVKLRNVGVTFFTITGFYDRVQAEIARDFQPHEDHLAARIRVIALQDGTDVPHSGSGPDAAFEAAWVKIMNDQPLICAKTGTTHESPRVRPTAAVLDMFVPRAFDVVRKFSAGTVKVYLWVPVATISVPMAFGEDFEQRAQAEAERRGVSYDSVCLEIYLQMRGDPVRTPCTPPMHHYEAHPQDFPFSPVFASTVLAKVGPHLQKCDGVLTFDAADYAPKATETMRAWFAETGRKVHYAGPLIPTRPEDTSDDPRAVSILKFLDDKLATNGAKSVIYIAFGSMFWPLDDEKFMAVLEILMEKNIPFVLSSAGATKKTELQEKLTQYANAIMADWVPQQALLDHPATGWYISHGGHNSTIETIMASIPTILWPIDADQPMNAIHLAETLDVAYELIEVRRGKGAGKIYRTGQTPVATVDAVRAEFRDVLERAFGEDGARKRENLAEVRRTLEGAWAEEGIARREVEAFLDSV